MLENVVEILLAEDNPNDVRLTLHALQRYNLTNNIHVVRDGAEALDFIFCTGAYAQRNIGQTPKVILLDLKLPLVNGMGKCCNRSRQMRRALDPSGGPDVFTRRRATSSKHIVWG